MLVLLNEPQPQPLQAVTTKIATNLLSYLGLWKADFLKSCVLLFAWNTTGYIAFFFCHMLFIKDLLIHHLAL